MLYVDSRLVDCHRVESDLADALLSIAEASGAHAGIYCGVGLTDVKLIESLRLLFEDDFLVLTHSTPVPLRFSYAPGSSLGLDRIAALCGAMSTELKSPILVVDAGTAITADLLLPSGEFAGGSIAPGISLRLASLHAGTARLPEVEICKEETPVCALSTRDSILSGCVWGAAMEIFGRFLYLMENEGAGEILLTGGDSTLIAERLRSLSPDLPIRVVPDLVGRGLMKIYDYNRTSGSRSPKPL